MNIKLVKHKIHAILLMSIVTTPVFALEIVSEYRYEDNLLKAVQIENFKNVTFFHNPNRRKTSVMIGGDYVVKNTHYDDNGKVSRIDYGDKKESIDVRHFDSRGRITYHALAHRYEATHAYAYRRYNIKYNSFGTITGSVRRDSRYSNLIESVEYDNQGQMIRYKFEDVLDYQYTLTGALQSSTSYKTIEAEKPAYYSQIKDNNQIDGNRYDDNGRLVFDGKNYFKYSKLGRLSMVYDQHFVWSYFYIYNDLGDRVAVVNADKQQQENSITLGSSGASYRMLLEGGDVVEKEVFYKHKAAGIASLTKDLVSGLEDLKFHFNDLQGTTVSVWNSDEPTAELTVVNNLYTPFGTQLIKSEGGNKLEQLSRYSGHRSDLTGLVYMGKRFYSPRTASFLTPDPIRDFNLFYPASNNLYQYVSNSPITNIDPQGLSDEKGDLAKSDGGDVNHSASFKQGVNDFGFRLIHLLKGAKVGVRYFDNEAVVEMFKMGKSTEVADLDAAVKQFKLGSSSVKTTAETTVRHRQNSGKLSEGQAKSAADLIDKGTKAANLAANLISFGNLKPETQKLVTSDPETALFEITVYKSTGIAEVGGTTIYVGEDSDYPTIQTSTTYQVVLTNNKVGTTSIHIPVGNGEYEEFKNDEFVEMADFVIDVLDLPTREPAPK